MANNIQGRFKPAKVFQDAVEHDTPTSTGRPPQIVSLAFDDTGEKCVTAGEDESFILWDAKQGRYVPFVCSRLSIASEQHGSSQPRAIERDPEGELMV